MINGHSSPISGVASHSSRIATAGYDNQVILWDDNKEPVARVFHDHLANQLAFSPDGRYLVTASSDHTARLWLVSESDLKLVAVFADHDDDVEMAAFHPSDQLIATASRDHKVRVFNFRGKLTATLVGHTADVISVTWSADGRELISSSDDGTVRVWHLATAKLKHVIDMNGVETDTLVVSGDGTIHAGNDEGEVSIIRSSAITKVPAHDAGIKRLVLDGGRGLLVSMSYDRTLKLWKLDPLTGLKLMLTATLPPVIWPRSCAFKGESELVLGTFGTSYATFDFIKQQWDLAGIGPTGGVNAVAVVNGTVLTVGDAGVVRQDGVPRRELGSLCNFLTGFDGAVLTGGQMGQVFDALTGELLYAHTSPLNCGATFTSAGRRKAVIGAYNGEALIFDKDNAGKVIFERTVRLHSNAIKGIACNDKFIFSVCATGAAAFHSTHDCKQVLSLENAHDKIANGAALSGEGFASVSRDRKLRLWTATGQLAEVVATPHTHSIKCVAASADGRLVATASYNGFAAVYDRQRRSWVFEQRLTASGISSLAATAAGFIAGGYDGCVYPISV